MNKPKIYLAHSRKDRELIEQIEERLDVFGLEIWHEGKIKGGDSIKDSINQNLGNSDIIMCFISSNFFTLGKHPEQPYEYTYYLRSNPMFEGRIVKVIGVLLKPYLWEITEFKDYKVLPSDLTFLYAKSDVDFEENIMKLVRDMRGIIDEFGQEKVEDLIKTGAISSIEEIPIYYLQDLNLDLEVIKKMIEELGLKGDNNTDKIINAIDTKIESLQKNIFDCLSEHETSTVHRIYYKIDQLKEAEQKQMQTEVDSFLEIVQSHEAELKEIMNEEHQKLLDAFFEAQKNGKGNEITSNISGKLKWSIPIIPSVLSYDIENSIALKEDAKNLIKTMRTRIF